MNPPHAVDTLQFTTASEPASVIHRKSAIIVDRYALLRLQQSPSSQGGHLIDFLNDRSRAKCASMNSQF